MALGVKAGNECLQNSRSCRTCVAPDRCVPGDSYRNFCVRNITIDTVWEALRGRLPSVRE